MGDTYETSLRATLAKKGVMLAPTGELELDPSYTGDDVPSQALLDVLNHRQRHDAVYSKVQRMWTDDLERTIGRMLAGDSTDPGALSAVFFLRLHGLAVDFAGRNDFANQALKDGRVPTPGSTLFYYAQVLQAVDGLVSELTEDEQLYAEYRRHVEAHVRQDSYGMQWNKRQGQPRDQYTSKFTRKAYHIDDLLKRIDGVIRRYGSESAIALDFARRLAPHAARVATAMTKFCTPKP